MVLISVKTESIVKAIQNHDARKSYYLDKISGEVVEVFKGSENTPGLSQKRTEIEGNPERYILIEPVSSKKSYMLMEEFALGKDGDKIRRALLDALGRDKPFKNFKNTLGKFPGLKKEWNYFMRDKMKLIAFEWLTFNEINARLV